MAQKAPSAVITENFGSTTLYRCTFTDIDDADTYTSNVTSAVMWWCNPTDEPTNEFENIDVGYAQSTGTFTFYPAEASRTGDLYILARS